MLTPIAHKGKVICTPKGVAEKRLAESSKVENGE
jgi:hypothetical protein